jgi:hypothetical protein
MGASSRVSAVAFLFLSSLVAGQSLSGQSLSDEAAASQILGPQWKMLARRAGMIFAGTVLATGDQTITAMAATQSAVPGATPAIQMRFHVDEAIAGVEAGQVLTVHEWTGVFSRHRPLRRGEHILIFLYPPSRLGLTSPVGGQSGLIALDSTGKNLTVASSGAPVDTGGIRVVQLERAIRSVREE